MPVEVGICGAGKTVTPGTGVNEAVSRDLSPFFPLRYVVGRQSSISGYDHG